MDPITIGEIIEATQAERLSGDPAETVRGVSTDSRTVEAGDLFIPLIGERNDAHDFLPQAAARGCRAFLVSEREKAPSDGAVLLVDDTLAAMQRLAAWYLDRLNLLRAAVTGSVGKTSTRDMLYHILSERFSTGRPQKNFNNPVGVPLTIFTFDSRLQAAVFEEGMDHAGMIHTVTAITRPQAAVITNIGVSHLENLGSRENIRKAKMEITDFMGPDDLLVINEDNDLLSREAAAGNYRLLTCGTSETADYRVSEVREDEEGVSFVLTHGTERRAMRVPLPGAHNALNAALAVAAASRFGVTMEEAAMGLSKASITGKRLKIRKRPGLTVVDDSYNAAPDSVKAGIQTLMNLPGERKVCFLADMNEIGPDSPALHREVGAYAAAQGVALVAAVGEKSREIAAGARQGGAAASWYPDRDALLKEMGDLLRPGDVVLVKGSNAMGMGLVADQLMDGTEE